MKEDNGTNGTIYKAGTYAYAVIADEVFHEVCEEFGSELLTGEELYRKHAISIKWGELPKQGTEKEIRKAARGAMEKTLAAAGVKKE